MEREKGWIFEKGPKFSELNPVETDLLKKENKRLAAEIKRSLLFISLGLVCFALLVYAIHGTFEWLGYLLLWVLTVLIFAGQSILNFAGIQLDLKRNKRVEGLATILAFHVVKAHNFQPSYYYLKVDMDKPRRLRVPGFIYSHHIDGLQAGHQIYIIATDPGNRLLSFHGSRKLNKGKK